VCGASSSLARQEEEALWQVFSRQRPNDAKHLKVLKWKTPFHICDAWKYNPTAFQLAPPHPGAMWIPAQLIFLDET
jgi:hypothetical protein